MELNNQIQTPRSAQVSIDSPSQQKPELTAVVQQYLMSHNNHQRHHDHHLHEPNPMTAQHLPFIPNNNIPPSLTDVVNNVMNSMSMDDAADLLLNDPNVCTTSMNEQNLKINNTGVNSDNTITCAINAAIAVGLAQQQMQQQAQNNEEHVCCDCQEIFKNKVSFNLHRRQKHGDKPPPSAVTPAPSNNTLSPGISATNCSTTTQHFSSSNTSMVPTASSSSSSEIHCYNIGSSNLMSRSQAVMLKNESDANNSGNGDGGGKTFTCQYCGELYKSRQSFTRHKNRAHSFTSLLALPTLTPPQTAFAAGQLSTVRRKSALAGKTRTVRCGKCEGTVSNQSNLCAHLRDRHGEVAAIIETSKFPSMADFYAWKSEIEKRTKAVYLKRRKKEHGDSRKHYYYCRRSGCFESKASGIRARLSNKVGYHCTGFITACENMKSNEVQVEYCTFHYCQDEQASVVSSGRSGGGNSLVTLSPRKTPKQNFNVKTEHQDNHCVNNSLNSSVDMAPPTVTVIPIPLLAEIQQQQQQSSVNFLQKNLETGNHTQVAGQQQSTFDSQASLPGKELKVSSGLSTDQQQSQNVVPPLQQQQSSQPSPTTSTSTSQTQPTKLVAVSGPGGATAYISSVDVGTLYGYELVDQGKIVYHSGKYFLNVNVLKEKKKFIKSESNKQTYE
uniref:C2H2-type domain-containing protein n=1 Tax=Romanomermis culicivorax TaxID=13658 RepID=A0A915L9T1_ROMCU